MFFISWSGVGILTPIIAAFCFVFIAPVFGGNEAAVQFAGGIVSAIALLATGLFFRKINVRRNLYFIPMEYWSIAGAIIAVMQIPHMLGMA